ncbi:hypothetical protein EDD37DRAFT_648567 [Exophiala viscosa]|uniref:uncharacterized protein n=1 Tax=Exophiala viscosa TaxID=2486360 RepID=UPI0021900005|nr:hypothetical protein EDD37DRAFT_648567 [Exophiala viscosa]
MATAVWPAYKRAATATEEICILTQSTSDMFRFNHSTNKTAPKHTRSTESRTPVQTVSAEEDDHVSALTGPAAFASHDANDGLPVPTWVSEINNSRVTRPSRASSIISTRTKISTTTFQDDARSIDIDVGGRSFRIGRNGSRITTTTDDPPPYSAPGETIRFRSGETTPVDSNSIHNEHEMDYDVSEPESGALTPRSTLATLRVKPSVRANILNPAEFNMPSPIGHDGHHRRSLSATSIEPVRSRQVVQPSERMSFNAADQDVISVDRPLAQPQRRSTEAGLPVSTDVTLPSPFSRQRSRIRLPAIDTSTDRHSLAVGVPQRYAADLQATSQRPIQIRSAGAILSTIDDHDEPRSPDYIGRHATGAFPLPMRSTSSQNTIRHETGPSQTRNALDERRFPFETSIQTPNQNHCPLPMDSENEISLHYARMMRKLDYGYRKALHLKDKEMAELRERLHEKDTVLRQQLRAKDFLLDDLKNRLTNLEENVQIMLEKARNEVEDLWESRWKDRDFHLRERMRRIEEDAQKTIQQLRASHPEAGEDGSDDGSTTTKVNVAPGPILHAIEPKRVFQ